MRKPLEKKNPPHRAAWPSEAIVNQGLSKKEMENNKRAKH
jgi:hypothetical protein